MVAADGGVQSESQTYGYDDAGQLTDASGDVSNENYTYDVNNLRIAKEVDGVVTRFVYDRGQVVLQFDGAGDLTHRYVYGPAVDQVLADDQIGGDVLWALTDQLGSVRDLVDSSGTVVDHLTYSAFGQVTTETAPTTHFLFGYTGAVLDIETGLGYHRARYLDQATGRWLSEYPIAADVNLYRYVGNSPPPPPENKELDCPLKAEHLTHPFPTVATNARCNEPQNVNHRGTMDHSRRAANISHRGVR